MIEKEFYTCDDRVYCMSEGKSTEVTEKDTDFIDEFLETVRNFYPHAYKALTAIYSYCFLWFSGQ